MKCLLNLIIALTIMACTSPEEQQVKKEESICKTPIKQPSKDDFDIEEFKVHNYYGGYVVGRHELTAAKGKDGVIHLSQDMKYDTIFVRLVFDPRLNVYYPFPDNQFGGYNTITEKDSCAAKLHWHKYTKQWKK